MIFDKVLNFLTCPYNSINSMNFFISCDSDFLTSALLLIARTPFSISFETAGKNIKTPNTRLTKHLIYRMTYSMVIDSANRTAKYPIGFFQSYSNLLINVPSSIKLILLLNFVALTKTYKNRTALVRVIRMHHLPNWRQSTYKNCA